MKNIINVDIRDRNQKNSPKKFHRSDSNPAQKNSNFCRLNNKNITKKSVFDM